MTGKRPTPLKNEPLVQLDELQELLTANLVATEKLKEAVATAAKNAVKELLEQRQRDFKREEEETTAQGKLTPQECYARMAAEYADVQEKCRIVCDVYSNAIKLAEHLNKTRDSYDAHVRTVDAKLDAIVKKLDKNDSCRIWKFTAICLGLLLLTCIGTALLVA